MYSSTRAQGHVGDSVKEIETPALLLCLDNFEDNLQLMANTMKTCYPKVALRPHAKPHKCPVIARKQIKLGAVGICCQTLTEADAMAAGGIDDIYLCNQVIGARKLQRLVALGKQVNLSVCVDSEQNIKDINAIAEEIGVIIDLVVEIDVGGQRCGVAPGSDVVKLAQLIQSLSAVKFKGLQCYHGSNQHVRAEKDRKHTALVDVVGRVKLSLEALKAAGIECGYITGGGTGTYHFEAQSGMFTEVQPGSYIFMDADYRLNLDKDDKYFSEFKQSLFVLTSVQSVAKGDRAVVDAGMKAHSMDSGPPKLCGSEDTHVYHNGGDEHGVIVPRGNFEVGDKVWLVPGHCDPTVNLYDWIIGLRNGKVETVWQISGRGPGV